jgi:hypothetical protein
MGVTFEDMVRKSMRLYWNKTDEFDEMSSNKSRKYNKKYFDAFEGETLPKEDQSKKELKKKDKY